MMRIEYSWDRRAWNGTQDGMNQFCFFLRQTLYIGGYNRNKNPRTATTNPILRKWVQSRVGSILGNRWDVDDCVECRHQKNLFIDTRIKKLCQL